MTTNLAAVAYIVSGVLFILALRGLSSPVTSRRGNQLGMIGMAIAVATTLITLWLGGAALVLGGLYYFFVHRHLQKKPDAGTVRVLVQMIDARGVE